MSINWRTSGDTTREAFAASLPSNSQIKVRNEVEAVYNAARPYTRLFRGVLEAESSGATNYKNVPASMNNPVNLRVRGKEPFQKFATIADCAAEWKARITDPAYAYQDTQTVADLVSIYAPSDDNNNEQQYVATVESVIASLPLAGGTSVELKPYAIAGTDQKIWSPVPIEVKLVPADHTNQRPGYALRNPHRCVQHETGNPGWGADADMHYRWLRDGADGSQLSFHFVTDDHKIIQLVPVNEVTWQAADGSGPGNYNGLSNEMCVNADGDMALARRNAEYLMGGLAAIFDMPDDYMERHYDFNWADPDRHYCPQYMMQQGYWPTFVANANAIKRKYQDGTIDGDDPIPVPTPYVKPHVWGWMNPSDPGFGKDHTANGTRFFYVPQTYVVTAKTGRQSAASKNAPPAGPDIAIGTQFGGHYVFRSNDDQQSYTMTKNGNRILSKKLLPRVQITKNGTVTVREMPNAKPTTVRKQGKPVEQTKEG